MSFSYTYYLLKGYYRRLSGNNDDVRENSERYLKRKKNITTSRYTGMHAFSTETL